MPITEAPPLRAATPDSYAVEYRNGKRTINGDTPAFTFCVIDDAQLQRILTLDDCSAARAYIRGEFDVSGDLVAALRLKTRHSRPGLAHWLWTAAASCAPVRIETWLQSRKRAANNIRFHYDRSNEFYQEFLDSRLIYSEGYFKDPAWSLEQAQEAKLEGICRDLNLRPGERFLDVGCGWGALVIHAAERFEAQAMGCTLSHRQFDFARAAIRRKGLERRVVVEEIDYRAVSRRFDKIASIGMFEHVGRHRLCAYFRKIYSLLEDGGLFLNSGIIRPQGVKNDPQTWFLLRNVFPGGELVNLADMIRFAEDAGFNIVRIESVRKDYALTCRAWVDRLQANAESCMKLVGEKSYRTWLLYLAASALGFESGQTDVFTVLMSKRAARTSS
jgi:cyclopropane-fatty-acyl-phospholipid synthase